MEIKTKTIIFKDPSKIIEKHIEVNEYNKALVIKRMEYDFGQIIKYLKDLREKGKILCLSRPKDVTLKSGSGGLNFTPKSTDLQDDLDLVVNARRVLRNSIQKIKTIFGNI